MKKIYSFIAICSIVLAALIPQKAVAGAATYENHVVTLTGIPEGAGVVYIVTDWNGKEWEIVDEMLYEEDEITVKATIETKDNKGIVHLYALPNDGYKFAGFFVDEDRDGDFDITKDKPITFSNDATLDGKCEDNGMPRVFTSSPALQVVLTHEATTEYSGYKDEGGNEKAELNKAAAEAAAESDWETDGCLNQFFAVFYEEGEENPITGIKAVAIRTDEVIYNLCGQRVGKDAKGLLIVGGKKKFVF
ncbi:MAG: hypothetical protein IKS80_04995 [Bacteroidaceae bacterium]|nr:hypothetical protein [Bacteroidaceae bacterium]